MTKQRISASAVLCRDVTFDSQRVATLHGIVSGEFSIPEGASVVAIECRVWFSIMFRDARGSHSVAVVARNRSGAAVWRSELPPIEVASEILVSVGAPVVNFSGSEGIVFLCLDVAGEERWSTALRVSRNPARPSSPPQSSSTFG